MLIFIGLSVIRRHLSTKFYCTTVGSWGHNTPSYVFTSWFMTTKRGQQKQARKRMTSCETGYLRLRVVSKIISPMTHITGVQRSYCQEHLDQDTLYCLRALLTLDWCFNYIVLR